MTPEEIKKINTAYAELNIPNGIDEEYARCVVFHDSEMFGRFLQWLSKDYAIVPKEQIYMRHGVANALMKQDPAHKEFYRGQSSVLESIFDKSLFEEEGEEGK